jgi:hypothetical protein
MSCGILSLGDIQNCCRFGTFNVCNKETRFGESNQAKKKRVLLGEYFLFPSSEKPFGLNDN